MMDKDTLRKADVFSGGLIMILGFFIISRAVMMPMKDSWGGVQNVWYVSPALFPLLVGGVLSLLGFILIFLAVKSTGRNGIRETFAYLSSQRFKTFLTNTLNIRFYAIVFTLFSYVFVMIPRVDFFPSSILFLLVLFFIFYLAYDNQVLSIFGFTIATNLILLFLLFTDFGKKLAQLSEFYADWFTLGTIFALCIFVKRFVVQEQDQKRKFRLCLIIGIAAPLLVGIIFKYFLLVPMPFEGLFINVLDTIWYAEFWS